MATRYEQVKGGVKTGKQLEEKFQNESMQLLSVKVSKITLWGNMTHSKMYLH